MSKYYPVFLRVSDEKCVVVGGGQVALRKVKSLLDCNAQVAVISPELCLELVELEAKGQLQITRREYQKGDLRGARLVIAATDSRDTNMQISKEAQKRGLLINVVDDAEISSFILPACLNRGDVTLAISTSGKSPALARKLRTKLEKEYGEEYASLAIMINEVRSELKQSGIVIDKQAWQDVLDLDLLLSLIKQGETEEARRKLYQSLKERQNIRKGRFHCANQFSRHKS